MSVVCLFLVVPWVCLQFVTVVVPDHTHYFSCQIKNRGNMIDFFLNSKVILINGNLISVFNYYLCFDECIKRGTLNLYLGTHYWRNVRA